MRRIALATAAVAVLAVVPAAEAKPKKRCKLKDGVVVAKNRQAVVWKREGGSGVIVENELWGCMRKNGKRSKIDSRSTSQAGGTGYGPIRLRETFVGYSTSGGGNGGRCTASAIVFSLAQRKVKYDWFTDSSEPTCVAVDRLLLAQRARAAFTVTQRGSQVVRLHKFDATGHHTVDAGAIESDSMGFTGSGAAWRLHWTNGDEQTTTRIW